MEQFIVSARKYRPNSFETLLGQENIARTLKNSIQRGQLAHAYLFCGPRGVGKTSAARIFAKTINCSNPGPDLEPCGQCESCRSFAEGRSYSIHELDAASNNSVDDIRSLTDQVRIPPQIGRYSVYIIDEVHMLSQQAFNAFLKTLEEPPAHAIFILATTEKHKILPTILSRCIVKNADGNMITTAKPTNCQADFAKGKDGVWPEYCFQCDELSKLDNADLSQADDIAEFNDQDIQQSGFNGLTIDPGPMELAQEYARERTMDDVADDLDEILGAYRSAASGNDNEFSYTKCSPVTTFVYPNGQVTTQCIEGGYEKFN